MSRSSRRLGKRSGKKLDELLQAVLRRLEVVRREIETWERIDPETVGPRKLAVVLATRDELQAVGPLATAIGARMQEIAELADRGSAGLESEDSCP